MLVLRIRDRDHPDYGKKAALKKAMNFPTLTVQRRGKMFMVQGEQIELFKLAVMAEALDRSKVTILDWEKANIFPQALYRLTAESIQRKVRLYSWVQVLNLHYLMWNKYQVRKSCTLDLRQLAYDMRVVFYKRFICVDEHGVIHDKPIQEGMTSHVRR